MKNCQQLPQQSHYNYMTQSQRYTGTAASGRVSAMAGQFEDVPYDPRTSVGDQAVQFLSSWISPIDRTMDGD